MKLNKLKGEEAEWAHRALNTQAEIVRRMMVQLSPTMPSRAPKLTKGEIVKGLRAQGYSFEPWHVQAALKVLKDQQKVKQVAQSFQLVEKK